MAHPQIQVGSKGDPVKLAQQRLIDQGYNPGPVDGDFGNETEAAVKKYQKDRSTGQPLAFSFPLKDDGVVGQKTWARLDPQEVQKGSKGDAVKLLQEILKSLADPKYDPGKVDSDFGPLTEKAVKAFQTDHKDHAGNPLKVDGIVGHKTWAALKS